MSWPSTTMPGIPNGSARRARSSIGVVDRSGLYSPYRLLVMMNTTGAFQIAAMLRASWNVPMFVAPSPKKRQRDVRLAAASGTRPRRPTAIGRPAPTIALAPMLPLLKSMRCIDPPTPPEPPARAAHQLGERGLGRHAQGERLAVAAVGVGLDVARLHRRDGADRDRLLALAQVGRALDLPAHEQLLDLLLEQPDADHRAVPLEAVGRGRVRVGHRVSASLRRATAMQGGTVSSFDTASWHPSH